jgi:hypothetical protein
MLTFSIILYFDEFKYFSLHLIKVQFRPVIYKFRLQDLEEIFCYSIVPAVSFPTHTLFDAQAFQKFSKLITGILNAAVRMKDQLSKSSPWSSSDSHHKCRENGFYCFQRAAHGPADDFPVKQIHNDGQVKPSLPGSYIGYV